MKRDLEELAPQDFSHYAEQARMHLELFTHQATINARTAKYQALMNACEAATVLNLTVIAYIRHVAAYEVSNKRESSAPLVIDAALILGKRVPVVEPRA